MIVVNHPWKTNTSVSITVNRVWPIFILTTVLDVVIYCIHQQPIFQNTGRKVSGLEWFGGAVRYNSPQMEMVLSFDVMWSLCIPL